VAGLMSTTVKLNWNTSPTKWCSRILTAEQREKHNLTEKTHFILIDFMDNHDDALFGMAEKRIKYYEEQGWQINIVDDPKQINWTQQKQK